MLPAVQVRVTADTAAAEAGLGRVEGAFEATGRAADQAGRKSQSLGRSMQNVGRSSGRMQSQIQNAAFQVGDFATQVAAGTAASRAMAMQLPQLLGAFGVFGAVAGALAAVGLPLLSRAFQDVGGSVKDFSEVMQASAESVAELNMKARELQTGQSRTVLELNDAINEQFALVGQLEEEWLSLSSAQRLFQGRGQLDAARDLLANLQQQLRLQLQAENLSNQAALNAQTQSEFAEEFEKHLKAALASAQGFSQTDIAAGVRAASLAAQALAENMQISLRAAMAMMGMIETRPQGDVFDPRDPRFGGGDFQSERIRRMMESGELLSSTIMDGGGAMGGGAAGDEGIGALAQSLMTQREMLETWRSESLERLADFNALELEALGGHNEAKLRIEEEYQQRLSELQQSELSLRTKAISEYTSIAGSILSSFASMQDTQNKEQFERQKKMRKAAAVIEGIGAAVAAWRTGMERGGPVLAAAYTAQSVAQTAAQISAISRATYQGGGSIGGAAVAGGGPAPLEVRLSGLSADTIVSGADVGSLLDRLTEEAGDRGYRILTA